MSGARTRRDLLVAAALVAVVGSARADGAWTLETAGTGVLVANVSLALDATGAPRMTYNAGAQPRYGWRDGGGWSSEALVTPSSPAFAAAPGQVESPALINFVTPSLALDPLSGEPRIAYSKAPANEVWYAEHSPAGWSYQRIGTFGDHPSLALDHDGEPHIIYMDYSTGPVYAVRSGGLWSYEPLGVGGYATSLKLDASGRPHVAMALTSPNSDLLLASRDAGGWSSEDCDTTGNVGSFASLALDASDAPHISYLDQSVHELRYAVRSGGGWTVETVASPIGDAAWNSLALAPDGEPFIAFHDPAASDLRFARREGGTWSSEPVESAGLAGEYCSLAMDGEGRPHIGYFDGSNNRVRYATRSSVVVAGVGGEPGVRGRGIAGLSPNPLPAGGQLALALRVPEAGTVALELIDPAGRRVASREAVALGAGLQTLRWDPGVRGAGLYFLRVRFGVREAAVARLVVLR